MEIKVSILDYLGKLENGIFVIVSLIYNGKYYEGMLYYTNEQVLLNVDDSLEESIGCKIENHKDYIEILKFLMKNVVPWNEMINRIDDIDFSAFNLKHSETVYLAGEIDTSEIIVSSLTQSYK